MRNSKKPLRRESIVNAAVKIIVKYGGNRLTIRNIAKEAGISEAAIYRHFKNKKEILYLLTEGVADLLISGTDRKLTPNHTTLETLDNFVRGEIFTAQRNKGMVLQIMAQIITLNDKQLNKKISDSIDNYIRRIRDLLLEGMRKGEIEENIDPDAAAILVFCMLEGLSTLWILSNGGASQESRAIYVYSNILEILKKR